ncbi:hypothetical protein, partial [Flavobacterium sp. HJJ]|uniref:Ig-like domain-containing protein n=1 Tax=Flavobacterium sp. HJJ TaxID=2783792 RepID=UPI00188BBBA9
MKIKLLFTFLILMLLQTSGFGQLNCNTVKNGDFTGGATGWTLQTSTTGWYYEATYAKDKIYIDKDGVTDLSLKQTVNGLLGGTLTLSFEITGQNADRLMCGTSATLDVKIGGVTYMRITNPANNATITTSDIIVYGTGTTYSQTGFPITVGGTGTGAGGGKPGIAASALTSGIITLTIPSWTGATSADLEFVATTSGITATASAPCNGTIGGDDWILDNIQLTSSVDPTLYDITGTSVCSGTPATIGLSGSQVGVSYQLVLNGSTKVGTLVPGTGSAIPSTAFGSQTAVGTYTVMAIVGSTDCKVMNGSFIISPNPTLTAATQSGTACTGSGALINLTGLLAGSTSTINYSINGIAQTAITGVVANASGAGSFTSAPLLFTNNGQKLRITSIITTSAPTNCSTTFTSPVKEATLTVSATVTSADAGPDQAKCNTATFTLAGNAAVVGTGAWSLVSGTATITTPASYNSGVTGVPVGSSATLRWTITNGACTARSEVILTNNTIPTVASTTGNTKVYDKTTNTTTVSATTSAGSTIDWYANLSGGTALVSGTTTYAPTGINAGIYTVYAEARNTTTGCVSASRSAVTLTITPKALTITAPVIASKAYDGSAVSGTVTAGTLSGFVGT